MPISDSYDDESGSGDVSQEDSSAPQPGGSGDPGTIASGSPEPGGGGYEGDALSGAYGRKKLSYANKYGPVLAAFDSKINATQQAQAAAAQTQTLAEQHARLASQRHAVAVQALSDPNVDQPTTLGEGQQAPGAGSQLPGNQPGTSLKDHLSTYEDSHFDEANKAHKAKTGKSADEMYDDLVSKGFVEPPDLDLTKREKSELFIHFGLSMLANRRKGFLESAGEAGQSTLDQAGQMKDKDKQAAYADYQRRQTLGIDQAKNRGETERADITQTGENTRSAADRASREGIAKMEEEGRNKREKAGVEKEDKPTQFVDDKGFLRVRRGNKSAPVLDETGNPVKAQRSAEDQAKLDEQNRKSGEARQEKILKVVEGMKKDILGSMVKDATTGKRRPMTEQEMTEVATKRVDAAAQEPGKTVSTSNPYAKFKGG